MKKLPARRKTRSRCRNNLKRKKMSRKKQKKNKKKLKKKPSLRVRIRVTKLFSSKESLRPTKTKPTLNKEMNLLLNLKKNKSQMKVKLIALKKLMIKIMSLVKKTPQKKRKI